jgi:hypothetical protein
VDLPGSMPESEWNVLSLQSVVVFAHFVSNTLSVSRDAVVNSHELQMTYSLFLSFMVIQFLQLCCQA